MDDNTVSLEMIAMTLWIFFVFGRSMTLFLEISGDSDRVDCTLIVDWAKGSGDSERADCMLIVEWADGERIVDADGIDGVCITDFDLNTEDDLEKVSGLKSISNSL